MVIWDFKFYSRNIGAILKVFHVFVNPLGFFVYLLLPSKPKELRVRTPIGQIKILMRNRKSARTLYSIFIREDYLIDKNIKNILDLGSNVGISALYFLTRNKKNRVLCVEPDPNNKFFLKSNLNKFRDRSQIIFSAIGCSNKKEEIFNISYDGKYSSFKEIDNRLEKKIKVEVITINDVLKKSFFRNNYPILLKVDIEGLEKEVLKSFDFKKNLRIKELIIEGKGFKNLINRDVSVELRYGYVEKLELK